MPLQLAVNLLVKRSAADKQKLDRLGAKVSREADDVERPFLPVHSDEGAYHRFVFQEAKCRSAYPASLFPLSGCRH